MNTVPALAAPGHYTAGRRGYLAVINHVMLGTLGGTRDFFRDRTHNTSAHYGVGSRGDVLQFVPEADTAHAVGNVREPQLAGTALAGVLALPKLANNPNGWTISIEWEGQHQLKPGAWKQKGWQGHTIDYIDPALVTAWWVPTEVQYQAGLALVADICHRRAIPPTAAHVLLHAMIDSVGKGFCPGQGFPLGRLLADLARQPMLVGG